jgi:hypothetical protein
MAQAKPISWNGQQVFKLRQANGALLDAPLYKDHHRTTNYGAIIDIDPVMPSGLARRFLNKGRGECLYLSEKMDLFDALEFASDYTTSVGKKYRERWYGIVIAKTDDFILLEECTTGATAVLRAKKARTSFQDRIIALAAEKQVLISRAAAIEEEIAQLKEESSLPQPGEDQGRREPQAGLSSTVPEQPAAGTGEVPAAGVAFPHPPVVAVQG